MPWSVSKRCVLVDDRGVLFDERLRVLNLKAAGKPGCSAHGPEMTLECARAFDSRLGIILPICSHLIIHTKISAI